MPEEQTIGTGDVANVGDVVTDDDAAELIDNPEGGVDDRMVTCAACGEDLPEDEAIKSEAGAFHPEHYAPAPTITCPECLHKFQPVLPSAPATSEGGTA